MADPVLKTVAAEVLFTQKFVADMTPVAADALKYQADASVKIAEANAKAAEFTHAVPAQEERKRDVWKTGIVAIAVLAIVGVAAVKLEGQPLAEVLGGCAAVLTAAWGVTEGIKAYGKSKSKALTPPVSPRDQHSG